MRPRPDAAENGLIECQQAGHLAASMRPRPDAAENSTTAPGPRPAGPSPLQ